MRIETLHTYPYRIPLKNGSVREGLFLKIQDSFGNTGFGEIAPLAKWSHESLEDAYHQIHTYKSLVLKIDWSYETLIDSLESLSLYPSVSFALYSALLSILKEPEPQDIEVSAFFSGSPEAILQQASSLEFSHFRSAKLKVSQLTFNEAERVIDKLKDQFHLRIDVNRAWSAQESLAFFAKYPKDAFDYIEEPFKEPKRLSEFTHPLAVDESFPEDLCLNDLRKIPMLKALIYKPTLKGGLRTLVEVKNWCALKEVDLVLSSSFESPVGLLQIARLAGQLNLKTPLGIGTFTCFDYLTEICKTSRYVKVFPGMITEEDLKI